MAKTTASGAARPGRPSPPTWIELLQEPAAVVDAAGKFLGVNAAFRALVCDPESGREPAPGGPSSDWLHTDPPLQPSSFSRSEGPRSLRVRAACGELEARLVELPEGPGGGWLLSLRPPAAPAAGRHMAALQELAQGLAYALLPSEVFRLLLDAAAREIEFDAAACVWAGGAAGWGLLRMEVPVDVAPIEREVEGAARELGLVLNPRPVLEVERSLHFRDRDRPRAAAPAFRIVAPLHRRGVPAGLVLLAASSPAVAGEDSRRLLLGMALQASLTLERLEASRAAESGKFQAVIDSMPAGVMLLDAAGRVRLTNPAAQHLLRDIGSEGSAALPALGDVDLLRLVAEVARSGVPVRGRETEQAGRALRLSLSPVRGAAFEEPTVLLVAEDVTEQHRVQQQLMQSEKLSSLGEMISGVAHELNNPLATVMGYAQLLLESGTTDEARKMLSVVDSEAARCQRIVQSLLVFARHHPPERIPVDLSSLLRGAVDLLAYGVRSDGVRVEVEISDGLPPILGDPHQLQQVFVNILQNACQALDSMAGERRICVAARREADGVRVEFTDSGPGIDPKHLLRIFDPFFTTKEVGRGTGLGLSLAYGVVQEHGGSIEARNHPAGGACFSITLPAAAVAVRPQESATRPAGDRAEPRAPGRRILIVEDEDLLAAVMQETLEREGYVTVLARDGEEALERLERDSFDLLISDVRMPGVGGRELHAEVLRRAPALSGRMVFVTGDVINPATRSFFEETGSPYITKPFKLTDLRRLVRSALQEPERSE